MYILYFRKKILFLGLCDDLIVCEDLPIKKKVVMI